MYILIVDNYPLIRSGIKCVLTSNYEDLNIIEADCMKNAVKFFDKYEVELAIIETQLDGENGFTLIELIKKKYQKTKILVLTGSNSVLDFQKAKDLKINGYLLKSALIEDFKYAIRVILRGENFYFTKVLEKSMSSENIKLKMLTNREKEVFEQLCNGLSNSQISNNLYISEATTKKHISNILNKLNLSNRIEVVFYAKHLYEC